MAEYEIKDGVLIIPEGTTKIEEFAFIGNADIISVKIPSSVTEIGTNAFMACCNLSHVVIPSSVKTIGEYAFSECGNLESILLPSSLEKIENCTFQYCTNLKSIDIPETVISIGEDAFSCCELESIIIPTKVSMIQKEAFNCCEKIKNVEIPSSVSGMDERAFGDCLALEVVTFKSKVGVVGMTAFEGCKNLKSIIVPTGTADHFKSVLPKKLHALVKEGDYEAGESTAHQGEEVDVSKYSEYATIDRYTIGLFEQNWDVEISIDGKIAECASHSILVKDIAPLVGLTVEKYWSDHDIATRVIKKIKSGGKTMRYTIELHTKYTFMPEIFPIDTDRFDPNNLSNDDITAIMEIPGDIPFCFGMNDEFGEMFQVVVKDEGENIIYESDVDNDFYEFNHSEPSKWVHYDDGDEDWEEDPELQAIVDAFNREHIMDDWEPGYYIVKFTKEKCGLHTYVIELDEPFDIKKLQLVYMQGYFGLYGDEWTSCRNVMYDNQYIEHGEDDDCCDFYGAYLYLYEKKKDENGEYWNEIKDLESYWEDD